MTTIGQDEMAQAMAERDPTGERGHVLRFLCGKAARLSAVARNEDAACASVGVASAVTPLMRAEIEGLLSAVNAIERGEHVPQERTPETVLRAMVAAYDRAAEVANVAYYRDGTYDEHLLPEATRTEMAGEAVRSMLYTLLAGRDPTHGARDNLADDYSARLSGKRDLTAPPMEDL